VGVSQGENVRGERVNQSTKKKGATVDKIAQPPQVKFGQQEKVMGRRKKVTS